MAGSTAGERHAPLEVHLPQQVGCLPLEPLIRLAGRSTRWFDAAIAAQDRMRRRERRRGKSIPFQAASDLARAPGRMHIANGKHRCFELGSAAGRARMRTTRAIGQIPVAGSPAPQPLVAHIRADPEPAAKLPSVAPFLHCQSHKLTTLLHNQHLLPWHGSPPSRLIPCNDDVSAMSPNTRQSCVRAEQKADDPVNTIIAIV